MLVVENLNSGYSSIPAIHGISFKVEKGQIVALLGSNGSGKTTILRSILNIIKPFSGMIKYNGQDIIGTSINKMVKLGISMVPEGRQLFPKMSVLNNLLMGAYSIKEKTKINKKLEEVYEIFPILEERKNQVSGTMSGGEQQMVAIGRALMSDPDLLILDEPSLGIMPILVEEIFDFILRINNRGVTILLVEQNVERTLTFADYAYVIASGENSLEGSGKDLLNNDQVRKVYLGLTN